MSATFLSEVIIPDRAFEAEGYDIVLSNLIGTSDDDRDLKKRFHIIWYTVTQALWKVSGLGVLTATYEVYKQNVQRLGEGEFCALLRNAAKWKSWRRLLKNGVFFDPRFSPARLHGTAATEHWPWYAGDDGFDSVNETEAAWYAPFCGNAADVLLSTISTYRDIRRQTSAIYAQASCIVNSSGTGKSRMVDQVAKKVVTIPICLRGEGSNGFPAGFPPADGMLRRWFSRLSTDRDDTLRNHLHRFFSSLFFVTCTHLKDLQTKLLSQGDSTPHLLDASNQDTLEIRQETLARAFRDCMTHGQSYEAPNGYRQKFFQDVVDTANESFKLMRLGQKSAGNNSIRQSWHTFASVHQEAEDLVRFLNPEGLRNTQAGPRRPLLILAFDDADVLAGIRVKEGSFLSELIRALGTVSDLPIFSLFLSTSANLLPPVKSTPFGALNSDVDLLLYPPITEISFDDLAFPAVEDTLTLNQVTEDKWIMHLGRPLFSSRYDAIVRNKLCHSNPYHTPLRLAKKKLLDGPTKLNDEKGLGSLACLSVRFALDFDLADKSGRDVSLTLIERHMRLCVAATTGFEKLVTTAASEPFLAEAARELMLSFAPFGAVRLLAENPSLSNIIRVGGQHGELIAALIIMRARDAAAVVTEYKSSRAISVNDFMRALLPIPAYETLVPAKPQYWRTGEDMPFSKAFEGYSTWFNHVIKVHQSDMINTKHLWKFITRGAMVMCVDNQLGIDIVLPICARDNKLSRSTVSAILIQVKNDKNFKYQVDKTLFECMDPFRVGLFSEGDRPLPVIRMVFALGSDKRGVVFPAVEDEIDTFTAYDIWCAGLSPHTFRDTAIDLEWYRSLFLRSLRPHDEFDFKDDKDNLG